MIDVADTMQLETQQLPDGWHWVQLGDVCDFMYGSSLPAHSRQTGLVPVYGSNGIVGQHNQALTNGPTIVIGRKGSIGEVHLSSVACWPIDTTYYIEKPKIETDLLWLTFLLKTLNLRDLNKAAAVPGLNRDDAYAISIPLPPLPEQQRIAAILTEQMAAVEQARAAAEAQLAAAKELPAAYLHAVFESDEAQRWQTLQVINLCEQIDYGYTASADFSLSEPHFLRITDIQDGRVDWQTVPGCKIDTSEEAANILADGDIVFARTGATTGKSFLIKNPPRAVFASYLIRLRPTAAVLAEYMYLFFQSHSYWQQIQASARGAAQPNVNATLLGQITLPLAPIDKQKEVVVQVSEQLTAVDQTRKALEDRLDTINQLPAALLRKAFSGEL